MQAWMVSGCLFFRARDALASDLPAEFIKLPKQNKLPNQNHPQYLSLPSELLPSSWCTEDVVVLCPSDSEADTASTDTYEHTSPDHESTVSTLVVNEHFLLRFRGCFAAADFTPPGAPAATLTTGARRWDRFDCF
jgi:hypothetical protein